LRPRSSSARPSSRGFRAPAANVAAFNEEVRSALRPILWLGALGGVGTFLFADQAIGMIYGQRSFAPAGAILKVYGPGLFLVFIDVLFGNALTAMGRATALPSRRLAAWCSAPRWI